METGIELIAAERKRQISKEGWTPEHDDRHKKGQMVYAAACYAERTGVMLECKKFTQDFDGLVPYRWPWAKKWWKPTDDHIRNLVKAGALIAAEIDRLNRIPAVKG